jgi:hypothetical protein
MGLSTLDAGYPNPPILAAGRWPLAAGGWRLAAGTRHREPKQDLSWPLRIACSVKGLVR